jgi:hypothetical protein
MAKAMRAVTVEEKPTSVPVVPRNTPMDMQPGRHLVGEEGFWIEPRGIGGDGREKFAIFSPNGELLGMKWGKDAAETAVHELMTTGSMKV